ncbi:hypothetical protein OSB04_016420 [Centaurea solstitialis]|uniref:PB1 domain-containing protein n=1 Tax=Centaurea solstitialis TaxID=347529 RepID=A0AA38T0X2_9ASTR|nr:hypothetical protein OSB04_016420 [Centaurea solstitialis]
MSTSGDAESISSSVPNSAPGSPRSRVKFLCSHGGKILPRPADGHLKYVGGETRVISVPYNITFADLMKKLSSLIEGDVILKYQLIPEDLDALVTVKSDEDLRLMFEEYDRHELIGTPRLRTFLFPANPIVLESQMGPMDPQSLEQRYINSVNGIVFNPAPPQPYRNVLPPSINTGQGQTIFSINSACSSPNTPPEATVPPTVPEVTNPEITVFRNKLSAMPRARSSPNLCNLGANSPSSHMNPTQISTLNLSIGNQQHPHPHHHYHHQNRYQPPPPPQPLPQPQPHQIHLHSPHPHPHLSSPKPPLTRILVKIIFLGRGRAIITGTHRNKTNIHHQVTMAGLAEPPVIWVTKEVRLTISFMGITGLIEPKVLQEVP